jgi:anti-sigma-K factor RskA
VAIDRDEMEGLAAEFVLGTLDADERRAAEARIAADPEFRMLVAAWERRLQPLADAEAPVTANPDTFGRIMSRIDDVRPAAGGDNVVMLRRSVRRWRIASLVAAAAAAVLAVFVVLDRTQAPGTEYVAMLSPDGGAPAFVLTVDTAKGTLSIRRVAEAAPADKSYQLWAVEPGAPPKSLGVVEAASYTRDLPYGPKDLVFAVSLEPKGGSPTDAPTGPVVFSGQLIWAR